MYGNDNSIRTVPELDKFADHWRDKQKYFHDFPCVSCYQRQN